MTVQAVRVLLATAMIESSSSSLVTSPSSLSFSAWAKYLVIGRENITRNAQAHPRARPGNYLNIDEFLLDLQQPRDLLLRLLQAPLQSSSRNNLSRARLTDWLAGAQSSHLADRRRCKRLLFPPAALFQFRICIF